MYPHKKKCACGSTKYLQRNHRDCPQNPKLLEKKKASSISTSNEQPVTNNTASVSSSRCRGTKPSKRSDPLRNQSPGGKGLNLPPPSSDEDSNPDDNDKSDGAGSNESDEESSKSSSKPEPKYYRPSFNRLTNDESRKKRYSPVIDIDSSDFKAVETIFRKMKSGTNEIGRASCRERVC